MTKIEKIIKEYYSLDNDKRFITTNKENSHLVETLSKKLEKNKEIKKLSLEYEIKELTKRQMKPYNCNFTINPKKIIGKGYSGNIYKNSDNSVLKVIPLNKRYEPNTKLSEKIVSELKITKIAGDLGIGPKVFDDFICCDNNKECYYGLYIEYIPGLTLCGYIRNNKNKKEYKENKKKIMKILEKKLKIMYKNNIIHGDLHDDNILIKLNIEDNIPEDVYIIDFGKSSIFNSKKSKDKLIKNDKDKLDKYINLIEKGIIKSDRLYDFIAFKLLNKN
jgi:tRNA A-37 threonylcarbamoyl transferase component Bud32